MQLLQGLQNTLCGIQIGNKCNWCASLYVHDGLGIPFGQIVFAMQQQYLS